MIKFFHAIIIIIIIITIIYRFKQLLTRGWEKQMNEVKEHFMTADEMWCDWVF